MPRDAGGNYTLPSGNPVVSGTVITSTWANPTMADIAAELTESLSRSGQGGMLVPFQFFDGTKNDPGLTFTNEPTTGIYRKGAGVVVIVGGGTEALVIDSGTGNVSVAAAAPVQASDLARKDYVDTAIANMLLALYPVGSYYIGPNPTSLIGGTWSQLAEGTFLMNTVGGADPSGGSNNAIVVTHRHTGPNHAHSMQGHTHGIDHTHTVGFNVSGPGAVTLGDAEGNDNATKTTSGATPAISGGPSSVNTGNAGTGNTGYAGSSGTNANKPKYVGVEVWQRTA